jgi:hypothetical protein
MTHSSFWPARYGKTGERDEYLAPALYVSIAIAIFAVVTQILYAAGAVSLSTTQLLGIWLAAGTLIVLLWAAYMIARASASSLNLEDARKQIAQAKRDAEQARIEARKAVTLVEKLRQMVPNNPGVVPGNSTSTDEESPGGTEGPPNDSRPETDGRAAGTDGRAAGTDGRAAEEEDAWVPPDELRRLYGTKRSVSTVQVFPDGCYLEPGSIRPDGRDERTGQQVYQCRVLDLNRALQDRPHETLVSIVGDRQLPPPSMPRFGRVEFEGLTITPYVNDRSSMRISYSLRATGIHPVTTAADGRVGAMWTAPDSLETDSHRDESMIYATATPEVIFALRAYGDTSTG